MFGRILVLVYTERPDRVLPLIWTGLSGRWQELEHRFRYHVRRSSRLVRRITPIGVAQRG